MAALHYGMMRATALMNKELDAAGGTAIDAAGDKRYLTAAEREAANVRACRLAGAISRMSATCQQGLLTLQRKRTGEPIECVRARLEALVGRWSRATR